MFCSRKTRTAYSSIPWSIAAASAGPSGFRQSTPATSPTNTGWSGRIETAIADFLPNDRFLVILVLGPKHKPHLLVRGRARPGHPRTAAGVLPASVDTRHKAGHERSRVTPSA